MKDPETPGEWQEAVDAAHGAMCLESARLYGLVTGGPYVHVGRCEYILKLGKARGIIPGSDAAAKFVLELMGAAKGSDQPRAVRGELSAQGGNRDE